ncbi:MAG: ABC transporter ATP-binding protein [Chloroflexota bacterium]|nr:ABC transporter ATP-binding protein [Chloroflexota bacterium]
MTTEDHKNIGIIPKLEIVDMHFSYNEDEEVLSNLSLSVQEQEFVSVIGDSGAGKTTLFRAINGLEKINQGYIRLDGFLQSSSFFHIPAEKRSIGTIFQDYALFPHLNVEKNIKYSLQNSNFDKNFYENILSLLQLEGLLDRYIDELSGGQKQRIALARSLVRKPKLLLMDEPFSNLDRNLRVEIRRELKKIFSEIGSTVLLITHDSEEALSLSDKVGFLYAGEIIQFSTPEKIYDRPDHSIIAKSISNSNVIFGEVYKNKVSTFIGDFILDENFNEKSKIYINVKPNQLSISLNEKNFVIKDKEFLEGSQLFILQEIDTGIELNVKMSNNNEFQMGQSVGIEIIKKEVNKLLE